MTTDPSRRFDAWHDPWIPIRVGVHDQLVSVRNLFLRAHEIEALGAALTPLDRDSLMRFLVCLSALIGRALHEEDWDQLDRYPEHAVNAVEQKYSARFRLNGDKPFLQRWDHSQSELVDLVANAAGKPVKGLLPINQLHPHEPGESSSKWAVRIDARDASDPAVTTLLLVTAWFQTKNGNGQDPWGGKASKGSSGTWHTNPFAVWYFNPTSLARTLWANTPTAWIEETDLPLFLDHLTGAGLPDDFADDAKTSVLRFSYAKTLPLLQPAADRFIGFVLGPESSIPLPGARLGKDVKEQLGRVHEHDHTRLYTQKVNKAGTVIDLLPRGSFGTKMSTAEGFAQWFRAERAINTAMNNWRDVERVGAPVKAERARWFIDLYSETTDGKGSREWADWDSLPDLIAHPDDDLRGVLQALLQFAEHCRWAFLPAGRIATGANKDVPAIVTGQAAFYTDLQPILAELSASVASGQVPDMTSYATQIMSLAERAFERSTDPLMTPRFVADVAQGRLEYHDRVRGAFRKSPLSTPSPSTKEAS